MPKPLDPKCQLCAKLPTAQAKVLHGTAGDGCWNPKVCHNRRSFYRHRSQNNSAEIDAMGYARPEVIAVEPPATYFAVLYLYNRSGKKLSDTIAFEDILSLIPNGT
jgi:hypothetical protein